MNMFKIEIVSVPDREKLVAEIWYQGSLIAEINQEGKLQIDFYLKSNVSFDFAEFIKVLGQAEVKLIEG